VDILDFLMDPERRCRTMARRAPIPDFTIAVEGSFGEDGVWVIKATLRFRDGLNAAERERLRGEGRLALLQGLVREGLRGRRLGAIHALVELDEGDGPILISPDEVARRLGRIH
jgi:hypothetical protein